MRPATSTLTWLKITCASDFFVALGLPFVNGNESMKIILLSIRTLKDSKRIKLIKTSFYICEISSAFSYAMVCLRCDQSQASQTHNRIK